MYRMRSPRRSLDSMGLYPVPYPVPCMIPFCCEDKPQSFFRFVSYPSIHSSALVEVVIAAATTAKQSVLSRSAASPVNLPYLRRKGDSRSKPGVLLLVSQTRRVMSMSEDVLAMTFSSNHSPTLSIDGMLMDSQTTAAVLMEAQRWPNVKELTLRSVTIDATVAKAAEQLFQDPEREWKKLELIHCTGQNARVIKASIGRAQHMAFTGSVPIAHNPRYSLDVECMKALGNALKDCEKLMVLSLKGSRLDRPCLEAFAAGLEQSTSLETLQLSHCAMEVPDVSILSSALQGNQHLTALSMAHCKIGVVPLSDESNNELCLLLESLVSHPTLQVLNLFGMYCTDRAVEALSSLLRAPNSALWHLGLKNNVRHPDDKLHVTNLFQALEANTALTYLQVSGNNVDDQDMEQLARIITNSNTTLGALNLTANNFGDDGIHSFARRLPDMKGLRLLDLQRNPFTEESKTAIIASLKENTELERLDLDGKFDATKAYYLGLNKGGRRLLQAGNNTPLGLWPLVLERTNRLPFSRNLPHAHLDVLYNLVQGPAVFQSTSKDTTTTTTTTTLNTAKRTRTNEGAAEGASTEAEESPSKKRARTK